MNERRYKTSRDYARLWRELQTTEIVCWVDYRFHNDNADDPPCRDICHARWFSKTAWLQVRGVCYLSEGNEAEFIASCTKHNVEWLPPDGEDPTNVHEVAP